MRWQVDVKRADVLGRATRVAARTNVRTKIAGIPAMLVLLVGVLMALLVRFDTQSTLRRELDERGSAIAREAAGSATDLILVNDVYGLSRLVTRTQEANPDVRYVMVLDAEGETVAHTFTEGIPEDLPVSGLGTRTLDSDEGVIRDVAAPVFDGTLGEVRIGLTETGLQQKVATATWRVVVITALVLLLALAAGLALAGRVSAPIQELVEATRRVAAGATGYRAVPRADDEIGVLARSFNEMLDRLAESKDALALRQHDIEALNAIAAAAGRSLDSDEVAAATVRTAVSSFGAKAGWLLVRSEGLEIWYCTEDGFERCSEPSSGCVCSKVRDSNEALVMSVPETGCSHLVDIAGSTSPGCDCLVCVPLFADGTQIGTMGLAFSEECNLGGQPDLLRALGTQVGTAMQNARLWAEVQRRQDAVHRLLARVVSAQEEERKRVARELHDETGQALTTLGLGLRRLGDRASGAERKQISELHRTAAFALEGVARLAVALRPAALDELGLVPALEDLAERVTHSSGLPVDIETIGIGGERYSHEVEVILYRVVQEALTNVCRHSGAEHASVLVQRRDGSILVAVEDDGKGLDLCEIERQPPERALGIFGMRERAELVGGEVTIESEPGRGTTVYLRVPARTVHEG